MSIQTYRSNARSAGTATLSLIAQSVTVAVQQWWERSRQRRALGRLDDRLLKDVGLSRADVEHELSKPFWQT